MVTEQEVEAIGRMLVDPKQPLHARFRALFTLRGLGGPGAIAWISQAFGDDSALLKHELAYCLGQMQDARAIPVLVAVLQDTRQEPMVRHEAGEALGAIGDPQVLELLKQYSSDPVIEGNHLAKDAAGMREARATTQMDTCCAPFGKTVTTSSAHALPSRALSPSAGLNPHVQPLCQDPSEPTQCSLPLIPGTGPPDLFRGLLPSVSSSFEVTALLQVAETCQLAVRRLEWLQQHGGEPPVGPYLSVDPAPPAEECDVGRLREALLDESRPLFERYRAMFALRNVGGEAAALALAEGLRCGSALFRHEVGYVLGQLQHEAAVPQLAAALAHHAENPMVRHECAEALGAIARPSCLAALQAHAGDPERVVRESCEVALDMYEHEAGLAFQYADGLEQLRGARS
ncbi:deoxyhypusine hydroxylase isoform X2 [Callithrix jacchus]